MKKYDHTKIEKKWQEKWRTDGLYTTNIDSDKPKTYVLDMFPYPSGEGLHVGHPKGYIATDVYSRFKKMNGFEVLHPMGWDAFGLPAENYAIKNKVHPRVAVEKNIQNFKKQLEHLGFNYDWSKEINTTDPEYYKWTQWIFLQLFKKGLAFESYEPINWCPSCQTGLANEDLESDGTCERCGSAVEKKPMRQWVLRITDYADRLLDDLSLLKKWPEHIKESQRNWIGKSRGAEIEFEIRSNLTEGRSDGERSELTVEAEIDKKRVLVLHGTGGNHTDNWQPWLKEKLVEQGYEVEIPDFPDAKVPSLAAWEKHIEYFFQDETSPVIIIAHSLGCNLALHLAEKYNCINSMILVAPPHKDNQDWDLIENAFGKNTTNALKSFVGESVDWDKVSNNCNSIIAFFSNDDPYIPIGTAKIYEKLGIKSRIFNEHGHFNKSAGVLKFPELLEQVQKANSCTKQLKIKVFTTRPDTLFGVTYMVLAPEHNLVVGLLSCVDNKVEVEKYIQEASKRSEMDRLDATKEKTGVELKGVKAINPANNEEIPVYIADYVLADYGTGAIMAVPAHDERDFEFAKKFGLPIKQVVAKNYIADGNDAPRDGLETLKRPAVDIIIEHPEDGTFLLQRENDGDRDLVHFVGGGTDGESDEMTLAKELKEETGFNEFELIGGPINTTFSIGYRHSKEKNQCGISNFYHIKLKNLEQGRSEIDDGKHTIEWVKKDDVAEMITWSWHRESWEKFIKQTSFSGVGILLNSDKFDGMDSKEAQKKITEAVGGKLTSTYRLNDWVFSRQRYWGEPIPIIHCEKCGAVPVPEDQLPVVLPEVENYEPTGNGESPLANITDWVNTTCPKCGGAGKRETNTMPQWAGSSWYYLRFIDPKNSDAFVDSKKEKKWMPVDVYVGGDHAVRHLIYARFWHKFLYDIGSVSTLEPFERLEFLGFILAEDGRKMSKRWGNVINPDEIVKTNGADSMRVYEMFMSPFENTTAWNTDGLVGAQRFLERVWKLNDKLQEESSPQTKQELHKTIKKVGEDIEEFKFNTAIAQMMIFLNTAQGNGITKDEYKVFIQLLSPFAPHIAEEIWQGFLDGNTSIHTQEWPSYDETLITEDTVTIAVQINGKVRGRIEAPTGSDEVVILALVSKDEKISQKIEGEPTRVIYVPDKLINLVF